LPLQASASHLNELVFLGGNVTVALHVVVADVVPQMHVPSALAVAVIVFVTGAAPQ
jgi:hypothetical protein